MNALIVASNSTRLTPAIEGQKSGSTMVQQVSFSLIVTRAGL